MLRFIVLVSLLELSGFLGFIILSGSQQWDSIRYFPIYFSIMLVVYVSLLEVGRINFNNLIYCSFILSIIFLVFDQVLGFYFYPGLEKDVDFISLDNFYRSALLLTIIVTLHLLLFYLLNFIMRKRKEVK